jgi:hypothetical protein
MRTIQLAVFKCPEWMNMCTLPTMNLPFMHRYVYFKSKSLNSHTPNKLAPELPITYFIIMRTKFSLLSTRKNIHWDYL